MYIAHLEQGGGCDYTIGCGHKVVKLKATTPAEALAEVKRLVIGKYLPEDNCFEDGYWDERELQGVTLYEVSTVVKLPLKEWYQDAQNTLAGGKLKKKEEAELKEFERLQKKFAKTPI